MASDRVTNLKPLLEQLKSAPGVVGVLITTRDGLPVADALHRPLHRELFSALSATVLGASEMALSDLGNLQVKQVVAETEKYRLAVFALSDDHLLVLVLEEAADVKELAKTVQRVGSEIAQVLK